MARMDPSRPWPVAIYSLGCFRVFCKGKPLRFPGRVHRKPLAMLNAIVAMGGTEVPMECIVDTLWPEADGDRAYKSFTTTLHRLRKLIGMESAIRHHEAKVSLDSSCCWVDVWQLKALLEDAESAWEKERARGSLVKAIELTEKAVGMFNDPYLPEVSAHPWSAPFIQRLRGKFVRCVRHLGRHWEQAGRWDKAITCYQKGLEADEFSEDFCYCLMVCYQRKDRVAEALATYERLQEVVHTRYGIEPSGRLRALARHLRRSRLPAPPRERSPV